MTGPKSSSTKKPSIRRIPITKQLPVVIVHSAKEDKENGDGQPQKKTRIETGMEKEEEKEIHVQAALISHTANLKGEDKHPTSIPIPVFETIDISSDPWYSKIQKQRYAKRRSDIEEIDVYKPFPSYDHMRDKYTMDEEDAAWIEKTEWEPDFKISYDDFEVLIGALEIDSRKIVMSFAAFCAKFPDWNRGTLDLVYDYWLDKRTALCLRFPKASLIPTIPRIGDENDIEEDPYVAFRKRESVGLELIEGRRRSTRIAQNSSNASGNRNSINSQSSACRQSISRTPARREISSQMPARREINSQPSVRLKINNQPSAQE